MELETVSWDPWLGMWHSAASQMSFQETFTAFVIKIVLVYDFVYGGALQRIVWVWLVKLLASWSCEEQG